MRLTRTVLAVAALAATILPTAPAAHATSVGDLLGGTTVNVQLGHSLSGSIRLTPVPTSLNGYSVAATCTATSAPDPASTAVDQCTVNGIGVNSRVSLPGAASAAATLVTAFRNTNVTACIAVSAQFVESALGPGSLSSSACFLVHLP